jgi:hypothetical protein
MLGTKVQGLKIRDDASGFAYVVRVCIPAHKSGHCSTMPLSEGGNETAERGCVLT